MLNQKKSELIREFLKAYGQENRFLMYDLMLNDNDEKFLIKRFKECLDSHKFCPSIAEILQNTSKETGENEIAWQEFKANYANNHRMIPLPDWVYTMKQLIGVHEVEEMTPESEKWVKKEFLRIIPSVRSGLVKLKQENVKYVTDGNVTFLDDGKQKLLEGEK